MAFTHGNFCLVELAEGLIDASSPTSDHTPNSDGSAGFAALGYVLYPLGMLNSFVALAYTAGIKRQGEYLADATAVELARYPKGLSEALSAMNHMFLVDGVNSRYRIFDSHPAIDRRILALHPDWDGAYMYESEDEAKPTITSLNLLVWQKQRHAERVSFLVVWNRSLPL